eukprot:350033-Chlamydomonas_euryale.AAC.12
MLFTTSVCNGTILARVMQATWFRAGSCAASARLRAASVIIRQPANSTLRRREVIGDLVGVRPPSCGGAF